MWTLHTGNEGLTWIALSHGIVIVVHVQRLSYIISVYSWIVLLIV